MSDDTTALSEGADELEPYLAEQMNDPEFVQGFAVAILANLPRIGGSAANANWMNARRAVKALSDAGLDIVKRPIGPESAG